MAAEEDPPLVESGSVRRTVSCPDCHAQLIVDMTTGAVTAHRSEAASAAVSLDDMIKHLDMKRQEVAQRFERERRALNDRGRLLDEKVKEALRRVDPDSPPPLRPIDLD